MKEIEQLLADLCEKHKAPLDKLDYLREFVNEAMILSYELGKAFNAEIIQAQYELHQLHGETNNALSQRLIKYEGALKIIADSESPSSKMAKEALKLPL